MDTLAVPTTGGMSFCSRIVGSHGYTGHESIADKGMYNANARLYDPVTGRFLSPDPLIQDPESTQNFNRYSYCLNNPLKYTDESGEFLGTVLTIYERLVPTIYASIYKAIEGGIDSGWTGAWKSFSEEWKQYGKRVANAAKIDAGLYQTDNEKTFLENVGILLLRFTWEMPQTIAGNAISHFRNNFWRTNVDYYHESTLVNRGGNSGWGFTIGNYINGKDLTADPQIDDTFAHEYGHVIQSRFLGPLYMPIVGVPSTIGTWFSGVGHNHKNEWYEVWANKLADNYYQRINDTMASATLQMYHPLSHTEEWYDYFTLYLYAIPFLFLLVL